VDIATGIRPGIDDVACCVDLVRVTAHRSWYVDWSVLLAFVQSAFSVATRITPKDGDRTAVVDAKRHRKKWTRRHPESCTTLTSVPQEPHSNAAGITALASNLSFVIDPVSIGISGPGGTGDVGKLSALVQEALVTVT